jgi:DNA-binding MarR family transcriptional regulator
MGSFVWLSASEQRIWRRYLAVTSLLDERLDRNLRRVAGLTLVEYALLAHLSEVPERRMRMSELAETILLSKSRLSHQVTRLEKDGLVRRQTCGEDRRGAWAVLTDKGYDAVRAAAPGHVDDVRGHLFDRLTEEQVEQFDEILGRIEEGLRDP